MSTVTPPDREKASFAETALRLGGKSEDEARRTGAVPRARDRSACVTVISLRPRS